MNPSIWKDLYWYAQAGTSDQTYKQTTWSYLYSQKNSSGQYSHEAGGRLYWSMPERAELQCGEDKTAWGYALERFPFDLHACSSKNKIFILSL